MYTNFILFGHPCNFIFFEVLYICPTALYIWPSALYIWVKFHENPLKNGGDMERTSNTGLNIWPASVTLTLSQNG